MLFEACRRGRHARCFNGHVCTCRCHAGIDPTAQRYARVAAQQELTRERHVQAENTRALAELIAIGAVRIVDGRFEPTGQVPGGSAVPGTGFPPTPELAAETNASVAGGYDDDIE